MPLLTSVYRPGTRVRVIQQMPLRNDTWVNAVEGTIRSFEQATTGSWFAHAKDDQLWLDRLEIEQDDGEIVTLVLDQYSVIEGLDEGTRTQRH